MPFKSKAQQRFMFAAEARGEVPKGTAKTWAEHTPNIKKLPEKKKQSKTEKKAAFIRSFVASFYGKLGMSKEAAVGTPAFYTLVDAANQDLIKEATAGAVPPTPAPAPAPQIVIQGVNPGRQSSRSGGHGSHSGSAARGAEPGLAQDLALSVGMPFVLGGLGGAGLARLFSPSQYEISNLQKEELITQYDNAIREMQRRMATRRI